MPKLPTIAYVVGIVLILGYLIAVVLQLSAITAPDQEWARRLEVVGGLEALAFAAAGAILGTTVQRQATDKADERADKAQEDAEKNAAGAEKGRLLEAAVSAKQEIAPQTAGVAAGEAAFEAGLNKELEELSAIARNIR